MSIELWIRKKYIASLHLSIELWIRNRFSFVTDPKRGTVTRELLELVPVKHWKSDYAFLHEFQLWTIVKSLAAFFGSDISSTLYSVSSWKK